MLKYFFTHLCIFKQRGASLISLPFRRKSFSAAEMKAYSHFQALVIVAKATTTNSKTFVYLLICYSLNL